jgi:hypothetical protein
MRKADAEHCRKAAEQCRINAADAEGLLATNAWLDLAADWTKLADAFDKENRPRWLN